MFKIVHISDLHLRVGWHEDQGVLLDAFFDDLTTQGIDRSRDYLVFSGDIVQAGSSLDQITEFKTKFGPVLEEHFLRENRIFCPGNHDVDRQYAKDNLSLLQPLAEKLDSENQFNTNIAEQPLRGLIAPKFSKVFTQIGDLFGTTLTSDNFTGQGFQPNSNWSVYILNTALYSFCGLTDSEGHELSDKHKLRIETRRLRDWQTTDQAAFRVLIAHHPSDWLVNWAQKEFDSISQKHFDLVLIGHEHSADVFARSRQDKNLIVSTSPALHTQKSSHDLGYSIISIDQAHRRLAVMYRQWAPKDEKFVTGAMLSGTDDGILTFPLRPPASSDVDADRHKRICTFLQQQVQDSAGSYKSLAKTWCEPRLSKTSEFESTENAGGTLTTAELIRNSTKAMIYAPQLFGLTTLGRHLCATYWNEPARQFLLYAMVEDIPGHTEGIEAFVVEQLSKFGIDKSEFGGFVVDSTSGFAKTDMRRLNGINKIFPDKRLYMLQRLPQADKFFRSDSNGYDFKFETFFLLSMDREQIRSLVRAEIQEGMDLDEDYVTQRIASDLEVLNIHRTPLHVKTLLAIIEGGFDNSPINRTEMLGQYLLLVFQNNVNLRYETIPDLRDSLYALGFFCAELLASGKRLFTKQYFMEKMNHYCHDRAVDLDVQVIFSVLARERILVEDLYGYHFNYTYWLYLFAAHQMYADEGFRELILREKRYANYPEVIEFYSGIDRRRLDLIAKLTSDLRETRIEFEHRNLVPKDACLQDQMLWEVDEKTAEKLATHIDNFLDKTELPTPVKDQIADSNYDYKKPYSQELRNFINGDTFARNIFMMIAAARALRNSDHVGKSEKQELLKEILLVWKRFVQIVTTLAPEIVQNRHAKFEDVFIYSDIHQSEETSFELALAQLFGAIPRTAAQLFHADLVTKRMGPLLAGLLESETDELLRYFLVMQIILSKPKGWVHAVSTYIANTNRRSYFLLAVFRTLVGDYRKGFNSLEARRGLRELLGKVIAKHERNIDKPNKKLLEKLETEVERKFAPKPPEGISVNAITSSTKDAGE